MRGGSPWHDSGHSGAASWPQLTLDMPLSPSWQLAEERMERNAVAAFLLMLRSFLQGHSVNQESLVQCQGPAIIGALLRKVGTRVCLSTDGSARGPGAQWAGHSRGLSITSMLETPKQVGRACRLTTVPASTPGPQLCNGHERAHGSPAADGTGGGREQWAPPV